MWRSLINRTGRKNKEKSALWPDFIYFNLARTHFDFDWMCVDFTLICFLKIRLFLDLGLWFLPVFLIKILHVFQFSERKNQGPQRERCCGSWLCGCANTTAPLRGPSLPLARQPDCVTANCVPNSHRELNNHHHPPPRKEKKKKKHLESSLL